MSSSPNATRLRPHAIALAAAALLSAAPSWAQTAPAQPAPAASQPEAKPAAAPAAAAPAAAKPAAPQSLETVVVSGTRGSIQSAISRKKNASTVSDSIVAEDVDQFPDKNVGEALSRVTGVQLTREFGEGSQVSIRGVEPDLNRVEINGASVLGTNGGAGRGAELRELASELIASIDVVKGSTADLTEGGVGGTVRINTRKPLDFTKRTLAATLSAEQSSSRGGTQPRGSLLYADKFLDGKLGVMANLVYDKVLTRNDYSRNTSWSFFRDWDFSPEKTLTSVNPTAAAVGTYAGCTALTNATDRTDCQRQWFDYSPRISRYGIWERDHERSSVEVTAQYKFSSNFDAYVSYQANKQAQRLNDLNFGTGFDNLNRLSTAGNTPTYNANAVPSGGSCTAINANTTPAGMVVENHHVTRYVVGDCLNVANQGGHSAFSTSARDFALDIDSKYTTAGFNFKDGDWKVTGLLVDSKSDYIEQSNNIVLTQHAPGLIVELGDDRLPRFTFPTGWNPEDNSSYVQAQLQFRPRATFNTERQAKVDAEYQINRPFLNKLMFGAQAREASSKSFAGGGYLASGGADLVSTADDINVTGANINQTVVWDALYTGTAQRPNDTQSFINRNHSTRYVNSAQMQQLIAQVRSRSPGTFFKGYGGVSGVPSSWMAPSYAAAAPLFDTSNFNFNNVFEAEGSDGKIYPQIPAFDIQEKIQAGYVRLDWDAEEWGLPLYGNVGVRYARTNVQSAGLLSDRIRTENSPGSTNFTDRVRQNSVVAVDNTYADTLPSFNATYAAMNGRLLARVGWAKVMSRPALNLLAPNITCIEGSGNPQFSGGDGVDDCTGGNPDLKPYRATKEDFSLEYYPSRDTQVSLALFRTKIDTYVRTGIRMPNVNFFGDGRLFDVTQPINGQGAQTEGLELAARTAFTFLPGWLGGFGADVNYTRMDYSYAAGYELISPLDGSTLPYPGLSKNAYNVGLWYDRGLVNARIAYHWRDRYYSGGNDVSGNPNFRDKTAYLDAKVQFRINKQFTVSLEGKNLTDQAEYVYSGDLSRPNELAWSGRRYYASLSYKL